MFVIIFIVFYIQIYLYLYNACICRVYTVYNAFMITCTTKYST